MMMKRPKAVAATAATAVVMTIATLVQALRSSAARS
jgi:hypothetical protein